ncbi:MAG: isocitrate/isopropylmalate family dehydrogenase [Georgfuchsia sp.]
MFLQQTTCHGQLIGVLVGEGIGTEVVPAALELLGPLCEWSGRRFNIRFGGSIGRAALAQGRPCLSPEVAAFVMDIFTSGGVLFCGPGADRFVYELRARFDLYCKLTPLKPQGALAALGPLQAQRIAGADIIAVRDNAAGVYQGVWSMQGKAGQRVARHEFQYREQEVDRILGAALALANTRRKQLSVIVKETGVPSISALWIERAQVLAADMGIALTSLDIDNAVFQLVANPTRFDVIVSPNMFGDVLADAGALLLGSRGMSYSGNFGSDGNAAYQTGHGAAWDIAGHNVANPLGQMLALAMMLEQSFAWAEGALQVRRAIADVLTAGTRTRDIAQPGCEVLGTRDMATRVRQRLENLLTV